MKIRKRLQLLEEFQTGISGIQTQKPKANEVPVNKTTDVDSKPATGFKGDVLKDVDSILNNLEVLSSQIDEAKTTVYNFIEECYDIIEEELEKEIPNFELISTVLESYSEFAESTVVIEAVNEAGAESKLGTKMWNFVWHAPRARKAQQKVNAIKLNTTTIELAGDDAPNAEQKAKLKLKAQRAKEQVKELQADVDDRYKDKGEYVQRVMQKEKILGKLDILKAETGMEDDPAQQADLKGRMKELQAKTKEEDAALKELEPSDKDKKEAAQKIKDAQEEEARLKKEADDAKAATDKEATDKEATDKEATDKEATDKEATDKEATDKEATSTEPTDKEATDKEATDKEATDKEATSTEPTDKEATDKEATDKEATSTEPTDKEATSTEPTDKEATDKEATNTEPTDKEATNTEPTDKEVDPKVQAIEDKIKEYQDGIDVLADKKDTDSKNKIDMLKAAKQSEEAKLAKVKQTQTESFKTASISEKFRILM